MSDRERYVPSSTCMSSTRPVLPGPPPGSLPAARCRLPISQLPVRPCAPQHPCPAPAARPAEPAAHPSSARRSRPGQATCVHRFTTVYNPVWSANIPCLSMLAIGILPRRVVRRNFLFTCPWSEHHLAAVRKQSPQPYISIKVIYGLLPL